ncbi:MAG: Ig-like domain-containing protein [Lachnospiraceae bacterium]|nr:Ig-like domain-containing protein [Lachnospiraceae bacterium]
MKRKGLACLMAAVMLVTTPSATVLGSESETQVSVVAVDAESEAESADAAEASEEAAAVSETAGAGNEEESETETETESETAAEAEAGAEEKVGLTENESASAGTDENQAAAADTETEAVEASDAEAEGFGSADADAEDAEAADVESEDIESVDAEAEDAESVDTGSADAETEDAEAADTDAAETESGDEEEESAATSAESEISDMESETLLTETEEDTEAATEEGENATSEEPTSEDMAEDDEAMAVSESAVSEEEEEPSITFDWDNMVTDYYVLVGNTDEITFEVLLSSYTGTITYQWYDDNDDSMISGATNSRYAVEPGTSTGWYDYYCTVTAATSAGSTSSSVWFCVYVSDKLVINYDGYYAVAPGGTVTLSVEAQSPNSEITYEWRVWNDTDSAWSEISGETASTLVLTNVTAAQSYRCIVSDGVTTRYAYFEVYVDSGLEVGYDNGNYYNSISPGETATLSVSATTNYGSLTYQWYRYENSYVEISGATGASYQTAVSGDLYCKVSDAYNSQYLYFYVYVESGLEAERNGDYSVSIKPGESEELSVSAASDYAPITYQWYYEDSAIEGATASAYTVSESGYYYCLVSDPYNSEYIWFYVTVNSGLSVTYSGLTYALEGGSVTMTVNASVNAGSLTYSWYYYDSDYSKVNLAETGNVLQIDSVTEEEMYYCRVSDDYGNYSTANFEIIFVDELTILYLDSYEIGIGESVTLSVQAVSPDGTITYQWYALDDEEEYAAIDGATSSTYTVVPTSSYSEYKCVVSDGVTTKNAYIDVDVTSNLSLSYTSYLSLDPGETGTISVSAESDLENATYTFTWYKYYESEDEDVQIGTAESNTTGISSLTVSEAGEYICRVTDSYETRYAWFEVEMDSGFEASADTTARLVETGGSATFSVTASTVLGTLSYSWYYYDSDDWYYYESDDEKVSVGSTASVTLSNLTTNRTYYCSVSDGYNSTIFSFRVIVVDEIGETAESFSEAKDMTLGTAQLATIASSGSYMYFKIVPTETVAYTFYSLGEDDTYGYLYDASQSLLTKNDDGGEDENFKFTYTLTAGATYYLAVRYYSSSSVGTFYVYAIAGDSTCSHGNIGHVLKVDATCTDAGNIEYWYCKDCGAMFSDSAATTVISSVTIAATGHSWDSGVVTTAATTTATGVKTYTCTVCGATKTETIAKLTADSTSSGGTTDSTGTTGSTGSTDTAHTHTATGTWVTTKEATCTEAGIRVQYCKDCGTSVVVKSETIAATGHDYGEWTTTSEATVFAPATQTRTCTVCGATETREYGTALTPTITVNASSIKLKKKQKTTALKVTGLAAGDSVVSWKSSNTKIVKVTNAGKITAKNKTGKATITITLASGLTKKIKVTVQKATVKTTKITVTSKKLSLSKGESYTLLPELKPITSGQKLTYKTSNKKVVTVNSKGKLVAKKKGTATITIKSGSKSVKVKVTVK